MKERHARRTVHYSTIVVERTNNVTPARVVVVWSDPAERVQWDVPGVDWEIAQFEQDFRVGGRESSRFGPKGGPNYWDEGWNAASFLQAIKAIRSGGFWRN